MFIVCAYFPVETKGLALDESRLAGPKVQKEK